MESYTQTGVIVDVGSLIARLQAWSDARKPRGIRSPLGMVLTIILLAKLCGENHFMGIAEWAKHRTMLLVDLLQLKRERMPHHSTYRRILAEMVDAGEIEKMSSDFLGGSKYFGRQVLLAIDGKVLRGTLDDHQKGTYLLAAYLPREGIVRMEVAVDGKGGEGLAASKLLKHIDLREKVVMGSWRDAR